MGVLVQGLWVDGDRHAGFTRLAFIFVTQQVFVGDDVSPMVTAGVVHAEQDLAESREAGEGLKGLGGQRGDAKNYDSGWQALGCCFHYIDALDKALVNAGAAFGHALFAYIH